MKASRKPSQDNLLELGAPRTYSGPNLAQISFPLGGIGTGSIGLSGRGGLVDWEIFNRPNLHSSLRWTFPLIWARRKGHDPVCRALMAPPLPPHQGEGEGDPSKNAEGLPHMDSCEFKGEYPFAWINFRCAKLPLRVDLEAYSPFIPSDPDGSGYPAAILRYTLTNRTNDPVEATLAWSIFNPIGLLQTTHITPQPEGVETGLGQNVNTLVDEGGLRGLALSSEKWAPDHPRFGSMALLTPEPRVTVTPCWLRAVWFTPMHDFWDSFSETGRFTERSYGPSEEGRSDPGALGVRLRLAPRASQTIRFYLTWYFPTFEKYWGEKPCCNSPSCKGRPGRATWPNYYASQFESAVDVARKLHRHEAGLHKQSMAFHDALFSSTVPPCILEAVSSQMAILKTPTCLRLTDGTFYGFEGSLVASGCCEGSCTHVWNYQQTLPFLFPSLERSMRSADYAHNLRPDGGMCFRLQLPIGSPPNDFHACADGQMGGIIKAYRDWRISGDDAWLAGLWPRLKRALEYAWVLWDPNRDGVMDGIQHNTYDIEFLGPNPLVASLYLAALQAGAEIADHLGELDAAAEYRRIRALGAKWIETHLFNGEFFEQHYDPKNAPQYQFGKGCLSDQLLGEWMASITGLEPSLPRKQIRRALKSIFRYNWRPSLQDHANPQRIYALGDEPGLLLCSWPKGGRPAVPFPYSDEVWTGIEYQVAAHLISEGYLREGLRIVQGVRDRHDGIRRNPWNEFECGNHYARAMAAYGLIVGFSGFTFDKRAGRIGFDPRFPAERFRTFWALDGVWGTYEQDQDGVALEVLFGEMGIQRLDLACMDGTPAISAQVLRKGSRRALPASIQKGAIQFRRPVLLKAGHRLTIKKPS